MQANCKRLSFAPVMTARKAIPVKFDFSKIPVKQISMSETINYYKCVVKRHNQSIFHLCLMKTNVRCTYGLGYGKEINYFCMHPDRDKFQQDTLPSQASERDQNSQR